MNSFSRLLLPLVTDLSVASTGWASRSLDRSICQTILAVAAGWQALMILAVVASVGLSPWPLLVAHAGLGVYALLVMREPGTLPRWPVLLGMAATALAGYLVSGDLDSVLVFAACWQINFASCTAGVLILRRWVVPAVCLGAAVISGSILAILPAWGPGLPIAIIVTQTLIITAMRVGLPPLLSLAERADLEEDAARRAARHAEVTRRVSMQVAEEARVLHDTAINTLGAIANGGAGVSDLQQVRQQCAEDLALLNALRGERAGSAGRSIGLRDIFLLPGLPIHRRGLDDDAIDRVSDALDDTVVLGLIGATREAITNATKHSGAAAVEITVSADADRLMVEIRDRGAGFDGETPKGRGLSGSVFGRAHDRGFDAELRTSPGDGTTIALTASLAGSRSAHSAAAPPFEDVEDTVLGIHRRGGLVWAGGVTVVGAGLAVAGGTNHYLALFPMIGIMTVIWVAARFTLRRTLTPWSVVPYALSTIIVFTLSAAATAFGTDGAVHWQALAATGAFVLLMSHRRPRRAALIVGFLWGIAVLSVAALVLPRSPVGAAIVIVAGCVGIAFSLGWSRFQTTVSVLSIETAAAQRRAFLARLASDAEHAAQETYRRWLDAGLESAITLLRAISHTERDPLTGDTRQACAEEEAYLRQLVLIGPEFVHLGHTMMPILRAARERRTPLQLRLGGRDASDDRTAEAISATIMRVVTSAPPHQGVTASVFPVHDGLQLTIVGAHLDIAMLPDLPGNAIASADEHASASGILQITFPGPEPDRRLSHSPGHRSLAGVA